MAESRIDEIRQWSERSAAPIPASLVDFLIVHGYSAEDAKGAFAEYAATGHVQFGDVSWGERPIDEDESEESTKGI